MRKRGERTLTELYDITERIREAEITPVLEGNCRIQGPADESDPVLQRTHLGGFLADKKVTFISKSYHMGIESGTCNVCSAPCSSCMHNNRTMLTMESKLEHGSSSNRRVNNEADSCSFICADGMHLYRSRICDKTQHTASEASNLLSTSSSHGSYSENAESKAPVTASVTCEASEGVDMPSFVPLVEEDQDQSLQQNKSVIGECLYPSNSHAASDLCHSASSKRDEELQRLEYHGDNISRVTGSKDSSIEIDLHNISSDKKISTYGYTSFDDLHCTKVKTKVQVKATDCHGAGNEQRQSNYKRQITCTKESSQKTCEDSANASVSDKATADVHITKHNSSLKGDSPWSPSQNRYAAFYIDDCKDSDCSRGSQLHVNGESSFGTQQAGPAGLAEKKLSPHLENSKACYAGNGFSADSVISMDPCLKNKSGLDEGITSDQVMKSTIINKEFEMFSSLMDEVSKMQESEPQPQQVMESGNSEPELTDVKVCDICGDAGREYLLAFCSRCIDGAEHTYCMRKMLCKVPEGDWLCEECRLKEETERKKMYTPEKVSGTANECKLKEDAEVKVDRAEKVSVTAKECKRKDHAEAKKGIIPVAVKEHSQVKKGNVSEAVFRTSKECKQEDLASKKGDASETVPGTLKQAGLKDTSQKFANKSNLKLMPKLDLKAIDPDVRKVHKELQSPTIKANRREESQEVRTPSRKRSLESSEISVKSTEMSSPRKKLASSRESSFKNLEMGRAMAVNMPPTNAGQNRNNSEGFSRSQSMLGYHSSKVQAQLRPPCGFLSRSISFNGIKSKPKVKQVEVASVKPKFGREFLLNDTRRGETSRLMMKSASFKSIISGHNTESASKSQFRVEDPRSPKQAKERNKVDRKNSFTLDRPLPNSSPGAVTNISLPRLEIKTALHDIKLSSTYESTNLRMNKGSDDANDLGRKEAKEQSISSAKILPSISLNPKSKNETQRPCQIPKDSANERSTCNDTLYNNAETMQCQDVPQIMELGHQDNKTKDSGYFSISRLEVVDGTTILRCQRCNETSHATQFCPIEKLPTSALKPSAKKNCTDGNKKRTSWQDAVETILNSRLQKNMRHGDESEELPIFSADASFEGASKVLLSSSSNHPRNTPLLTKGTSNGQEISRISDVDPSMLTAVKDVGLPFSPPVEASPTSRDVQLIEASFTPEIRDLDATTSISEGLNTKHLMSDQALVLASSEDASKVLLSSSSNHPRNTPLLTKGTYNGQEISRISDVDPSMLTAVKDVGLPFSTPVEASPASRDIQLIEASFTPEIRDLDATTSISEGLNTKHLMSDQALVLANLYRTSAIPRLEFIWQGSFELLTTGNESAPFDGIQAHASTSASPKVLELATNFPCKVQLEEVPWNSSRPFQQIGPDERDIALFFFAKDVESYERSYGKLLGKMLTNDLALRGIIDGVELLIFPSTKLPLHSQRWNRLFFLWGMFKGRMAKSFVSELNTQKKPFGPDLNVDPVLQDLPCVLSSVVPDSHKAVSVENPQDGSCMCDVLSKTKVMKSTTCEETWATSSPKVDNRMCSTQCSPVHNSSFQNAAFNMLSLEQNSCLIPITNRPPCSEVKIDDTYLNKRGNEFGGRHAVAPSTPVSRTTEQIRASRASTSCSTADCRKGEESRIIDGGKGEEISMKNEAFFYEDPCRKRASSCSTEAVSQAHDRECKKIFFSEGRSNGNFREEIFSAKLPSNVQPLFPSYLNEHHRDCRDDDSGESINPDNIRRQDERFFFPVKPDNPIHILSSDEEDAEESKFPNLELALWDKKNERKGRQWKEPLDEDVSASLSLSLALPSPTKDGWQNPNLNLVRHLQESPDVNTTLLLFGGGLTDT